MILKMYGHIKFYMVIVLLWTLSFHSYNFGLSSAINFPEIETTLYQNYDLRSFDAYTVTLMIEQPIPGTRIVVDNDLNAGHAFLRIGKHGSGAWSSYMGFRIKDYVQASDITGAQMPGEVLWQIDSKSKWNVGKTFTISKEQAYALLQFGRLWDQQNSTYDMISNNCATFVVKALAHIGINSSITGIQEREWNIPPEIRSSFIFFSTFLGEINTFIGHSPADAGEDLKRTSGWFYSTTNI
jgi:hypothetical protein